MIATEIFPPTKVAVPNGDSAGDDFLLAGRLD
jgi:hypothetical protein